jgi:uncharacterized protein
MAGALAANDLVTGSLLQVALGLASGGLVGFTLGLVGGGGSILAVPLMVYVVGVPSAHVAIGTSAVAVAANAAASLSHHARRGTVRWPCAAVFAGTGALGSTLGKMMDGQKLLALFAVLMLVVSALMLKGRSGEGDLAVRLNRENLPRLLAVGGLAGLLAGFFGIGGGFLIVPGLMLATGMTILNAIASSLVAVTVFGMTTAANYAFSGLVEWWLAIVFIAGGALGGLIGTRAAHRLAASRGTLNIVFGALIAAVAAYMLARSLGTI